MRKILLATALMGATLLAHAGDGGGQTVSFNLYASNPDNSATTDLKDGTGFGLRYGYMFNNRLEWDVGGVATAHDFRMHPVSYVDAGGNVITVQDPKIKYWAATTDLNFHFHPWDSRSSIYFGGGVGYNNLKSDIPGTFGFGANASDKLTGFLWEVDLGANVALNEHWNLKIDGRQHYFNLPSNTSGNRSRFIYERFVGIGAGYSWGGGPCKDTDGDGVCDSRDNCANTPSGAQVDSKGCIVDEDGDGVADNFDKCHGTPKGAKVDASGCELDDDGDGVVNSKDKCPNTPRGATVDANGCPMDSDADGVWDGLDRCPNTPKGAKVDASGCPIDSDDDGDGVPNSKDKCPNTPRGTKTDSSGCPAREAIAMPLITLSAADLTFASGSAKIPAKAHKKLDEAASKVIEFIKANPDAAHLQIAGHTDNKGSAATNERLSLARANAVRAYLVSKGVPGKSLVAKGFGPSKPIGSNDTPEGRATNRRVEVIPVSGAAAMSSTESMATPAPAHKRKGKKKAAATPKKK